MHGCEGIARARAHRNLGITLCQGKIADILWIIRDDNKDRNNCCISCFVSRVVLCKESTFSSFVYTYRHTGDNDLFISGSVTILVMLFHRLSYLLISHSSLQNELLVFWKYLILLYVNWIEFTLCRKRFFQLWNHEFVLLPKWVIERFNHRSSV